LARAFAVNRWRRAPEPSLAERLLEANVPFVFVTGYDASEIPPKYRRMARCEKPLSMERLLAALRFQRPAVGR
jgi:hypothetical protein